MDRLRPGDVSPTATLPDDYRDTHDVSPLSPVIEAHLLKRGVGGRPQTPPTGNTGFPQTPLLIHHDSLANQITPSSPVEVRQSTSPYHATMPEATATIETPRVHGQEPAQTTLEERGLPSSGPLHEVVLENSRDQEKPIRAATAATTGLSQVAVSPPTHYQSWNPIWLRDCLLIGLGVGFAITAIAILALYLVSSRNVGLDISNGPAGLVYLWKYIPTTVIAILLAMWNCVDFTARLLQPWVNMKSGPVSAERSIFLDLISPTLLWPSVFKLAAETWSTVPMLTISGVIMLNIALILSTALFQVELTGVDDNDRSELATSMPAYMKNKVDVKIGAAAPTIALLLACLGLSVMVLFKRGHEVVPRDPRSIGDLAILMQHNPDLSLHFRSSFQHLRYHLQHERFLTTTPSSSGFRFAILREGLNPVFQPATGQVQNSDIPIWWRPLPLKAWVRITAILLALALVGVLEVLQRVSDHSDGIMAVGSPVSAHYAFIVPAIIIWTVGLLYASINFNTALFAPYSELARGSTAQRSLFNQDVDRLPILQLVNSLMQGRIPITCTSLSAVIGRSAIIIISGLYSTISLNGKTKVVQNNAPKLALQVVLAFMALCLAISWSVMQTSRILPHNPCSIAGMATLLAGGELWKGPQEEGRGLDIPRWAEWMTDKELKRNGVWKDLVFGLGWWPDGRYGIDAGGRIDETKRST